MHQQRPGRTISRPNPMNPTPMIVADDFTPRDIVMATGTMPTRATLPPIPTITKGPRNEDITDDGIPAVRVWWGDVAMATWQPTDGAL